MFLLGTVKDFTARLSLKEGVEPRFHWPRPVPLALKAVVSEELNRLVDQGILEQVDSSSWAAPIVVVPKKNGGIRVCGDYKVTINPHLAADIHPLSKPDDIFSSLVGGKLFSKIDLSNAYQQIVLDEDSKAFLTINTQQGLFRYTRLLFEVASAPAAIDGRWYSVCGLLY